jgi:hypothetical protein
MRIECQDYRCTGLTASGLYHPIQESPMAMVVTIKIADGDN